MNIYIIIIIYNIIYFYLNYKCVLKNYKRVLKILPGRVLTSEDDYEQITAKYFCKHSYDSSSRSLQEPRKLGDEFSVKPWI